MAFAAPAGPNGSRTFATVREISLKTTYGIAGRALVSTLALAGALAGGSASQAAVRYVFEYTSIYAPSTPISFEYTSADFIDAYRVVPAADFDACISYPGTTCGIHEFFPDSSPLVSSGGDPYDAILFMFVQGDGGAGGYHYFENGALEHAGVYDTVLLNDDGRGRLTVTADVPEPATWAMLLLGFSGLGAALRARRRGCPEGR